MKKVLIIIFLLSPVFSFAEEYYPVGDTEYVFNYLKRFAISALGSQTNTFLSIKNNVATIRNIRTEIMDGMATTFENIDSPAGMDYQELDYLMRSMPLNAIDNKCDSAITSINNSISQIDSYSLPAKVTVDSSSSNIVYSVDMGIVTNIYEVLAVNENNIQSIMTDMSNDISDILNVVGLLSSVSNSVDYTSQLDNIYKRLGFIIDAQNESNSYVHQFWDFFKYWIDTYFEPYWTDVWTLDTERNQYLSNIYTIISTISSNNVQSLDYSILTNFFGRPNNKYSFDRFSSKLRGTNQGSSIDFTFKSPYDSLQNINAANFSALLAGGFSNGLIEFASINNYLYYVEKFLTTNQIDNAKINDSLYALSNMVGRIDSYVTEDFSNEFFNLCRTIEGLTNSFDSVLGSMTNFNNDLNLSLTNIEISLESIITNQLKSLSFYSAFSNQFNTVISNQTLFSDYLFNSDNVLSDYTDGSYYDFLTNRYISGSNGSLSNWYERIETLLAALTFSAVSQSNLTTQVDNEDDLKQRFKDILTQSVNENTQTSIIKTANDSQGAIIDIVRGLSSTISSVASQHSIVFGWGDNETVKFEDFVGGNFHITVSGHGVDQFTMVGRAVSTLCWIVVTCLLVFKFSLWMARVGYKLYTFIRSVLFALWGK